MLTSVPLINSLTPGETVQYGFACLTQHKHYVN